jgi:hypothetical protein
MERERWRRAPVRLKTLCGDSLIQQLGESTSLNAVLFIVSVVAFVLTLTLDIWTWPHARTPLNTAVILRIDSVIVIVGWVSLVGAAILRDRHGARGHSRWRSTWQDLDRRLKLLVVLVWSAALGVVGVGLALGSEKVALRLTIPGGKYQGSFPNVNNSNWIGLTKSEYLEAMAKGFRQDAVLSLFLLVIVTASLLNIVQRLRMETH